ncbi:MAG: universal stress protein [Chromatiaceae bacterium]|nr:universal stress protein [Gammaproteobacteria bacterium]MCB1861394.1 universal stress protein [Gammaproteobacteria bacterium]MCB1903780.1 universal stress protein [Gammaproteobacteria bacterium]MCP5427492.1 universal stress protein [Chromatiaceae bacterium]MCP5447671.1 universal stress protein [Chromatiaceae bacterium]
MVDKVKNKPLLVPVDFSPHSEAALLKACELSDCMKLPILVLHVVHDPSDTQGYYKRITKKKQLLRIEDIAQEMLDEYMDAIVERYPKIKKLKDVERMLVVGLPVTRILEVAEKRDVSMVIMGSQGRTGLKHIMLGSKAEQIVRLCPQPVTIVKKIQ